MFANGTRARSSLTNVNVLSPIVDRSVLSTQAATLFTMSVIWTTASSPIRPTGTMMLAKTASRVSVATAQEQEGTGDFSPAVHAYADLQDCSNRDTACLDDWARTEINSQHCCLALDHDLRHSPGYQVVVDGPGASIFERKGS